jgi:uncharacterized protein YecE (DUF72 family)
MSDIKIGTSGYSYNEWCDFVYPKGTAKEDYLTCYGRQFDKVEVNSTYYEMPTVEKTEKILVDCGSSLSFAVKAPRTLTDNIDPGQWQGEAATFLKGIELLIEAGRLEAVLFQFHKLFMYEPENRSYLDRILKFFKAVPLAVEFRSADWYNGRVITGMRERNVAIVSLDLPELAGMPPSMDVVTSDFAYIRMYGRNREAWYKSEEFERFNYLYDDKELEACVARIERIKEQVQRVLVYFLNHPLGKSVQNAERLIKLIKSN